MSDTQKRIINPEGLNRLGKQLRLQREQAGVSQGRVRNMRQATISKIENGGDVTLDTFISYASSLGLEVALVPIGQERRLSPGSGNGSSTPPVGNPVDLLTEFDDLKDDE